jgi:hypothetical protein
MAFHLKTSAFEPGGTIPAKFTCSGEDVSPALTWSGAPAATKSFALIVDDPDAPSGTFTHWLIFNLPPQTHELPQGVPKSDEVTGGARQGQNDFQRIGYSGPCPPPGKPHRYFFHFYALNAALNVPAGASRRELEQAMQSHILAQTDLMGRFERQ